MLEIRDVTKSYVDKSVLDRATLVVDDGDIVGIVGRNGIGKTTFLDIISGVTRCDSGFVLVDGKDIRSIKTTPNVVGYVQDGFVAFPYMTCLEFLNFLASVANIPEKKAQKRIEYLADMFYLSADLNTRLDKFSKGMKKRVSIMGALLGNPKILVMDEPTNSLDSEAKEQLVDIFQKIKRSGKIVVMTTNNLEDIEKYCDKVALLSLGRISYENDVLDILSKSKNGYAITSSRDNIKALSDRLYEIGLFELDGYDNKLIVYPTNDMTQEEFFNLIKGTKIKLDSVSTYYPSFKDLFFKEVGNES